MKYHSYAWIVILIPTRKNIISFSHTGEFPISCNNYGEIYRTHTRILGVLLRKAIHIQYDQFRK